MAEKVSVTVLGYKACPGVAHKTEFIEAGELLLRDMPALHIFDSAEMREFFGAFCRVIVVGDQ